MPPVTSCFYRYGPLNAHDLFKAMAMILMVIDHIGEFFLPDNSLFRALGRGAAPLFFFLIGYVNKLHVTFTLISYGLILSVTNYFIYDYFYLNILLNFIFIQYFLVTYPVESFNTFQRFLLFGIFFLMNFLAIFWIEYGFLGFFIAYSAKLIANKDPQGIKWLAMSLFAYFIVETLIFNFTVHPLSQTIFFLITVTLFWLMIHYPFPLRAPFKRGNLVLLILSRYSLPIYFFHLLALQILYFIYT